MHILAAKIAHPAHFSIWIFLALIAILLASTAMFWVLVRRWTTNRWHTMLGEWGKQRGYRMPRKDAPPEFPKPLLLLKERDARISISLASPKATLLQVRTDAAPAAPVGEREARWHLFVREIDANWPPTGLRPVAHATSVLDFYSMSSFPSLGEQERFVLFGTDSTAARGLSGSSGRALLPSDIGMLLHGNWLILDFSSRPFDPIEFDRMIVIGEQILNHLPVITSATSAKM